MRYIDLEQNFFGREEAINLLKRRVIDLKEGYRQNIALLGNQYVGKSSILKNFILNLDHENVISIYLDLENKDFNYLFSKFTGSLLYNFAKSQKLPLHDDFNLLLETAKSHVPHTVQVIKKIQSNLLEGKIKDFTLGLLALPEIFSNETGSFCTLVIDEFQNLEELLGPNIFKDLGKKIMTQKKCLYIVSSSQKVLAQRILSEKLSLLFGNFEVVHIEPFDLKTSQDFIEYNLQDVQAGVQLKHFLTDFTGGHPLYLNLICKELINLSSVYKQNEIYIPLLSQAVENTIFNRWGVISRHFELIVNNLCSGKENKVVSSILISLSNGKNKIDDIVLDISVSKNQTRQRINRLIEQGVVVKNGNFHYFADKLFKYWIKYVHQKRLCDVEFSPDKQKKEFKEEFNRSVDTLKANSNKDFSSRIVELLHCFDNESFNLNGRKYKLPSFREVYPSKIKNENGIYFDVIKAKSEESTWFIIMKKDNFCENDISSILNESKKMKERLDCRLIISLTDLDENARLRALQEKCWIWNEKELRALLTVFDKPYILR
ncbi:MAG: ATP-binding protein [Candidatus Zapsychrus exili]|nr:ATP-binding protein [Candidatus Zapsychrus exili]